MSKVNQGNRVKSKGFLKKTELDSLEALDALLNGELTWERTREIMAAELQELKKLKKENKKLREALELYKGIVVDNDEWIL